MKEFTAGAIKHFPDGSKRYVPLFPYFYCEDVQQKSGLQDSSDSPEEESKHEAAAANGSAHSSSQNSLARLKLVDVAPPKDVNCHFFGSRKTAEGENKYEKL